MESQHNVDTWLAEIAPRPRVFNHNLHLRAGEFAGFELVNTVTMNAPHEAAEIVYLFARRKPKGHSEDVVLRVAVGTHDDARHALLALGAALDHCMNPDIPRAGPKLARLADIGFELRGDRAEGVGAASFSVGNVVVTVQSVGETRVDVTPAAAHLGQWLGKVPDAKALRARRAVAFAPADVRLKSGEAITLVEQLPEPRADAPRIQVVARDGELRREGAALLFAAAGGGVQDVALYEHPPHGT